MEDKEYMKIILDNINVFSGIFEMTGDRGYPYIDCDYMLLMSIIKYYNADVLPVYAYVDTFYKFKYDETSEPNYIGINTPNYLGSKRLLEACGINELQYQVTNSTVLEKIRESLGRGNPINFQIDLFYQKGRHFFYNNAHAFHSVLAYGIDDDKQEVYVIDNVNKYKKTIFSFSDIELLCNYDNVGEVGNDSAFEYRLLANENIYDKHRMLTHLYNFAMNMVYTKNKRTETLFYILDLSVHFEDFITYPSFESNINSILQKKCSELYKYRELLKYIKLEKYMKIDVEAIDTLIDEINKKWKNLYMLIGKDIMRKNTNGSYHIEKSMLIEIYKYEMCLYMQLNEICENACYMKKQIKKGELL